MSDRTFVLNLKALLDASDIKGALSEIQKSFNNLNMPTGASKGLTSVFSKLSEEIKNFEALTSKDVTSKADFSKIEKSAEKIGTLFSKLNVELNDLSSKTGKDLFKLLPESTAGNISKATKALGEYNAKVTKLGNDVSTASQKVEQLNKSIAQESGKKILTGDQFKALKEEIKSTESEITSLENKIQELNTKQSNYVKEKGITQPNKSSVYREYAKEIEELSNKLTIAKQKMTELATQKATSTTYSGQAEALTQLNTKLAEATQNLEKAKQQLNDFQNSAVNGSGLSELINLMGKLTGLDMSKFKGDIEGVGQALKTYVNQEVQRTIQNLNGVQAPLNNFGNKMVSLREQIAKCGQDLLNFDNRLNEIQMLKNRIQYFFGLNNAIQLVKRTIRSAFQTIKDLDKAMTATAVVTDFSVGDMWSQLGDYTKRANQLGVSTKAVYEASTLYYQQGLKTNEVMAMSNETLRMARIAGLDAAEATDRMTNAIRGFNMEINEANAQRIDDVYSKLAAISASDVDEISTAMTKVASLAHNANMEFETTAALLAQIIETTRESPETAGTALKTVVARFSEVKKLVSEDQLNGTDEEGQAIDVNKVSAALRTAGIDLNKYFLGEVGLDDIFMELASKWDSLTSVQQRYIATQAAGSRQQSRFIAMMQNYKRTQELVSAAYNSEGAAAKQFAKTQDSLESKLAKLKNAWDRFAMGILNSDLLKGAVDVLTWIVNAVNDLTSAFGHLENGIGGVISSLLKLTTLALALKLGKAPIAGIGTSLLGNIGGGYVGKHFAKNAVAGTFNQGFKSSWGTTGVVGGIAKGAWGGLKNIGGGAGASALTGGAGLKAGLLGLGKVALVLAAIAAALQLVQAAWYAFTEKGQLAKAKKAAEEAKQKADEAEEKETNIKDLQQIYKEATGKVTNATTESDRRKAIEERNAAIEEALKTDPTLAQYVITETIDDQLVLTIDEEALQEAAKIAADAAADAAAKAYFGQGQVDFRQSEVILHELYGLTGIGGTIPDANLQMWQRHWMTAEEAYSAAIANGNAQKGGELYREYLASRSAMQGNLRSGYAERFKLLDIDPNLLNELMPLLIEAYDITDFKTVSDEGLQQIAQLYKTSPDIMHNIADLYSGKGIWAEHNFISDNPYAYSLNGGVRVPTDAEKWLNQPIFWQFAEALGLDETEQQDFFKRFMWREEELYKKQVKNVDKLYDNISKTKTPNYSQEDKNNLKTQSGKNFSRLTYNTSPVRVQELLTITEILQNLLPEQYETLDLTNLIETENLQPYFDFFTGIDLGKPIDAFLLLNKTIKEGDDILKDYAGLILDVNKELFTTGSLVQSAYNSLNDESLEALSNFIKENGYITADNIEELAKTNKDLNKILEENIASATALANIFTLIEKGSIGFSDLNDSLIAALGTGQKFANVLSEINKWIEEFNQGESSSVGNEHIVSLAEEAIKIIEEEGRIDDIQVRNIYDHIFGEGKYQEFLTEALEQGMDPHEIQQELSRRFQAVTDIAKNEGEGAVRALAESVEGIEGFDTEFGFTFTVDFDQFENPEEYLETIRKALSEYLGFDISTEAAQAIMGGVSSVAPGYQEAYDNFVYRSQLRTLTQEKFDERSGVVTITPEEVVALADLNGRTTEEVLQNLKEVSNVYYEYQGELITPEAFEKTWTQEEEDAVRARMAEESYKYDGDTETQPGEIYQNINDQQAALLRTFEAFLRNETDLNETEIQELLNSGMSNDEILSYMAEHGGENSLYYAQVSNMADTIVRLEGILEKIEQNTAPEEPGDQESESPSELGEKGEVLSPPSPADSMEAAREIFYKEYSDFLSGLGYPEEEIQQFIDNNNIFDLIESMPTQSSAATIYTDLWFRDEDINDFNQKFLEVLDKDTTLSDEERAALLQTDTKGKIQYLGDAYENGLISQTEYTGIVDILDRIVMSNKEHGFDDYDFRLAAQNVEVISEQPAEVSEQPAPRLSASDLQKQLEGGWAIDSEYFSDDELRGLGNDAVISFEKIFLDALEKDTTLTPEQKNVAANHLSPSEKLRYIEANAPENYEEASGYASSIEAINDYLGEGTFSFSVEPEKVGATIQEDIDEQGPYTITLTPSVDSGGTLTFIRGLTRPTAASGGIVGSYASGNNKIKPGKGLTGELGPEIVWNGKEGYAYITGMHGPQFQDLKPGDQIFNANDTKKILQNHGKENLFGSYGETVSPQRVINNLSDLLSATGLFNKGGDKKEKSSGGGGGSEKSSEEWKNELDWLYDLMEDIAEEEHKQTLIQSEYELAEKDLSKTGRDLYNLTKAELDTLQTQLSAQQFAFEKRLQQMNELQQKVEAEGFQDYLRWNSEDNTLEIDWDKINEIKDKDTYDKLSELVSDMEKVQGQMDDAQEATLDIKKQIQELQTRFLQAYLDFQNKVMDALVAQYQQNIDNFQTLNDTINEANESILDSIQKEIDLQRQIRDNTETEAEIADLEARIAYLLRDSTGSNEQELQELQKQLKEAREGYADTLVDQAIDRLSQNNSDAQEQREKQIELLEAQLEYWKETGALWGEVADLIAEGFNANGSIIEDSRLWDILADADSWNGLSLAQKANWADELINETKMVGSYLIQLNKGEELNANTIKDSIIGQGEALAGAITTETRIVRAQLNELIAQLGGTPIDSIPGDSGYASGGLATKTGFAMLHGSTNEPEYVLNARQTDAFLRLADVLPSIFGGNGYGTNNFGGNVYVELNMSVGEIGSDYDVDRLVDRVKEDIYDASSYRNVNAVSFLR